MLALPYSRTWLYMYQPLLHSDAQFQVIFLAPARLSLSQAHVAAHAHALRLRHAHGILAYAANLVSRVTSGHFVEPALMYFS